jgi:hypothetical protein
LVYNTETAKPLGSFYHGTVSDNFYYHETLYKKKTGEYFLYGEGQAGSKYARPAYGDTEAWEGGEDIIPLTFDQAKKWFEKANDDDSDEATSEVYDREFGQIKDGGKMVKTSVALHEVAYQKLQRIARQQGIPRQQVIENLIMAEQ